VRGHHLTRHALHVHQRHDSLGHRARRAQVRHRVDEAAVQKRRPYEARPLGLCSLAARLRAARSRFAWLSARARAPLGRARRSFLLSSLAASCICSRPLWPGARRGQRCCRRPLAWEFESATRRRLRDPPPRAKGGKWARSRGASASATRGLVYPRRDIARAGSQHLPAESRRPPARSSRRARTRRRRFRAGNAVTAPLRQECWWHRCAAARSLQRFGPAAPLRLQAQGGQGGRLHFLRSQAELTYECWRQEARVQRHEAGDERVGALTLRRRHVRVGQAAKYDRRRAPAAAAAAAAARASRGVQCPPFFFFAPVLNRGITPPRALPGLRAVPAAAARARARLPRAGCAGSL